MQDGVGWERAELGRSGRSNFLPLGRRPQGCPEIRQKQCRSRSVWKIWGSSTTTKLWEFVYGEMVYSNRNGEPREEIIVRG